jgi:hypothetical protein
MHTSSMHACCAVLVNAGTVHKFTRLPLCLTLLQFRRNILAELHKAINLGNAELMSELKPGYLELLQLSHSHPLGVTPAFDGVGDLVRPELRCPSRTFSGAR